MNSNSKGIEVFRNKAFIFAFENKLNSNSNMKDLLKKSSRKGPVVFTDPCPESPVSKVGDILQAVAVVAAIIVSVVKR
jgi:hypothetical protein